MPTQNDEYARPARPPDTSSLAEVLGAARKCTACHLYKGATQTVFGEGPKNAPMMLVGEQPGDYEDVAGKPFVGPAGKIMDRALEEAGIDRSQVYVTNAVKHFKWEPRGKRRIHQKPNSREIAACRPWLEAELRLVKPKLLVCPRGDRCSSDFRAVLPGYAGARQSAVVQAFAARSRHGAPLFSASAARRGLAPKRIQTLRFRSSRRFESRWRSVKLPRTLSRAPVLPLLPRYRPS